MVEEVFKERDNDNDNENWAGVCENREKSPNERGARRPTVDVPRRAAAAPTDIIYWSNEAIEMCKRLID